MENSNFVQNIRQFNRFYTNYLGLLDKSLLQSPYSLSEVRLMFEIQQTQQCTAVFLQNKLNMDAGYLSRLLKNFAQAGLIEKETSTTDARSQIIRLSPQGITIFNDLNEKSEAQIISLTQKLSNFEKENLITSFQYIRFLLRETPDKIQLAKEITLRTDLRAGDIGSLIYLHSDLYTREYDYGLEFEIYVAQTVAEFAQNYQPSNNRVWICEHQGKMIGFLALMNRGETAQLRYFFLKSEYRGLGLGTKMMDLFMDFLQECGYHSAYLLTTNEQVLAGNLYKKYGFRVSEEKESTAFGKKVIEQRYDLNL